MPLMLGLFAAIPAEAGLITNGDFEANGAGNYIISPSGRPAFGTPGPVPTGWTTTSPGFAAVIVGVRGDPDNPPFNLPSHVAAFYGSGELSQSFATVAGTDYVLSFDGSGLAFEGVPRLTAMTVTLFDGPVSLASTSYMESASFVDPPQAHSLAFRAGSATTRLEFSFIYNDVLYDGRYFALIDNVAVTPSASAAPEPASWALLLLGSGLIAGLRYQRSHREPA
jgi:hypothetical protein